MPRELQNKKKLEEGGFAKKGVALQPGRPPALAAARRSAGEDDSNMVVVCWTASLLPGACVLRTGDESAHGPNRARHKTRSPLSGRSEQKNSSRLSCDLRRCYSAHANRTGFARHTFCSRLPRRSRSRSTKTTASRPGRRNYSCWTNCKAAADRPCTGPGRAPRMAMQLHTLRARMA